MEAIGSILKAILKILWKGILIVLWAGCKISEFIFQQATKLLKDAIDKN